jgi:predicted enzyme related to lactoylglutathione lyase
MSAASGRFVWFDLLTPDVQGAKSFYGEITGWKTSKWAGGNYEFWTAGDKQVGGVMAPKPDAKKMDGPPHWIGYVATEDVDQTVQRTQGLKGRVCVPGEDIPNVGRFAVLADPQGAAFSVFKSNTPQTAPDTKALGHFGWSELNTTDWKSAWKFYSELFGWRNTSTMDMGPEFGEYFMFGTNEKDAMGGMSNAAKMMKVPAHWLHYINIKSTDETAKKIAAKGGKVLNGPMDVPGGGRIAQCMDPQGAMFAIFSMP